MPNLSSIFTVKPKVKEAPDQSNQAEDGLSGQILTQSDQEKHHTYYQLGYDNSRGANGSSLSLKTHLSHVYQSFLEICRKDLRLQAELKKPHVEKRERYNSEKEKTALAIKLNDEEIGRNNKTVQTIEQDIQDVKVNPSRFGIAADDRPKMQLYLGLAVLVPITIYLLVFYISASYSAFFKDFENSSVTAAIFDGKALERAYNDGWLERVFVCTIPFAFMGLGYLIHMFNKEGKKGRYKIGILLLTTFIFDGILAYLIEKKIYDFEKTLDSPPFDMGIAVTEVEFWGIIFAGFVTYLIWGLVLDFVMKEYENLDKIKQFIKSKLASKADVERRIAELTTHGGELRKQEQELSGKISEKQQIIDGIMIPEKKYLLYHTEYMKGWFQAIDEVIALPKDEKNTLKASCMHVSDDHLASVGINNIDVKLKES